MIETSPVDVAAFREAWPEGQQQRVSHQETTLTIIDQITHCDQSHPRWRGPTGTAYYHLESLPYMNSEIKSSDDVRSNSLQGLKLWLSLEGEGC